MPNGKYTEAVIRIVDSQRLIIGPLADEMANKVSDMKLNGRSAEITGDPRAVIENLVRQYEYLFGKLSVQVSKESIRDLQFNPSELPEILR